MEGTALLTSKFEDSHAHYNEEIAIFSLFLIHVICFHVTHSKIQGKVVCLCTVAMAPIICFHKYVCTHIYLCWVTISDFHQSGIFADVFYYLFRSQELSKMLFIRHSPLCFCCRINNWRGLWPGFKTSITFEGCADCTSISLRAGVPSIRQWISRAKKSTLFIAALSVCACVHGCGEHKLFLICLEVPILI